jgi:hypothetical protein
LYISNVLRVLKSAIVKCLGSENGQEKQMHKHVWLKNVMENDGKEAVVVKGRVLLKFILGKICRSDAKD